MSKANYEWRQIPNGPRLAVATLADSECVALTIHVPAGSRDESGLPAGLAHFVEHMVFKGTDRRSAREMSFEIENAGGQINACTSEDQTTYEGRGEAEMLPVLADVLADMVWHATFPEAEIHLEREVIGEEITMYRESPSDHIGDLISSRAVGRPSARQCDLRLARIHRGNRPRRAGGFPRPPSFPQRCGHRRRRPLHRGRSHGSHRAASAGHLPSGGKTAALRSRHRHRPDPSMIRAIPTSSNSRSPGTHPAAMRNPATPCDCSA